MQETREIKQTLPGIGQRIRITDPNNLWSGSIGTCLQHINGGGDFGTYAVVSVRGGVDTVLFANSAWESVDKGEFLSQPLPKEQVAEVTMRLLKFSQRLVEWMASGHPPSVPMVKLAKVVAMDMAMVIEKVESEHAAKLDDAIVQTFSAALEEIQQAMEGDAEDRIESFRRVRDMMNDTSGLFKRYGREDAL